MQRWVEYYLKLYCTENVVSDTALNAIKTLPVMTEIDDKPTLQEIGDVIQALSNCKAPGSNRKTPEVIREVADSRVACIFIRDMVNFHCDSRKYESQFIE